MSAGLLASYLSLPCIAGSILKNSLEVVVAGNIEGQNPLAVTRDSAFPRSTSADGIPEGETAATRCGPVCGQQK